MIIDTTNDELLINGQRWQRGGYLLATAYATEQINITARDGRVIGKAIEWDRILDKDKNTFGLDRDGTVTALTNIFNSQVKSPYKIDALRDVEDGTAAYGEIMIYRSPGEWQYEVLEQYHGAYDSEAATLRSGATATLELYYTAQADGDGISELSQSNTPASGYQIIRKLYYAEAAQADPDTGTWVQFADVAANTSFNDAKTALLAYLKERTGGTVPISLKMTWEEELIPTFLLDDYGGAAAAYSLRRLSSTYTGDAIRVRRASDNAEQDIGFDIEGNLNTAALASFCSGTDGFVKTWYSQTGSNDATQTTTGSQPKIYDSATGVVTENGKPAIEFNGDFLKITGTPQLNLREELSMFLTHKPDAISSSTIVSKWYNTPTQIRPYIFIYVNNNLRYSLNSNSVIEDFPIDTSQKLVSFVFDKSTTNIFAINGNVNTFSYTSSLVTSESVDIAIGAEAANAPKNYFTGTQQEVILYPNEQSANRTGIESNINTFYSIY